MLRAAAVLAAALVMGLALSGCDAFTVLKDGMQHTSAVEADLQQSVGLKPDVGFNWRNGHLASVSVAFPRLYDDKPLAELAGLVRAAVTKEFKQAPDSIVVSFVLPK